MLLSPCLTTTIVLTTCTAFLSQGMMQVQPGLQYGAPGPSGMYPPAGQYISMPQQQQNEQLRLFWLQQQQEIQQVPSSLDQGSYWLKRVSTGVLKWWLHAHHLQVGTDPAEFKNHQLPLARIKKVMPRAHTPHSCAGMRTVPSCGCSEAYEQCMLRTLSCLHCRS